MLAKISDMSEEEISSILKKDMSIRRISAFEQYFSDVLIILQKTHKQTDKKGGKKGVDEFIADIAALKKDPAGLLFNFDDSYSQVLRGFTIDLRIFSNLLRKMVIIKLNHDRIWTRQFYSEDLKTIYVVLKPLDSVIEARAMVLPYYVG